MSFGDVKSQSGLQTLNNFLSTKSYIEGFQPSTADKAVFEALSGPPLNTLHHALRWYNHIKSFGDDRKKFAPSQKDASFYVQNGNSKTESKEDDDDDVDLFGSDDDEEIKERVNEQILKAYEEKKAKKPGPIAKSSVILEVKPWTDETDMKAMEECVRSITAEGLVWGVSKLEPVGFGIHKLKICCVVEDEKVSVDWLQETIQEFEEHVQSADVAAFNKI